MTTHWERRDRKLRKAKRFKSDNRKSIRSIYNIILKKAQEVKDGRQSIVRSSDEHICKDHEKRKRAK